MKIFTLIMILFPILGFGQATELFFSEYGEGHSSNKFYEIYNGTGATVDLSLYSVVLYSNGNIVAQSTLVLSGNLANNTTYVVANSSSDITIKDLADTLHGTCGYNGDDVLELSKNGVVIDVFGEKGVDPGTSWTIAGNANAAVDKVLTRKASICSPTDDWALSFGTDAVDSQWEINALTFNAANMPTLILGLGSHTANCSGTPCPTIAAPVATSTSACSGGSATLTATATETGSTLSWFNVATGGTAIGTGASFTTPAITSTTSFWVEESVPSCPASPRTEVIVNISGTAPTATATSNSPVCVGGTLNLTGNTAAGATYAWTGPNSFTSTLQNPSINSVTALASGTYNLSITEGGCTSAISSVIVVVNSLPVISAGADKSVCAGESVTLAASGASSYVWSNGVTNNVAFTPTATATYTVTGTATSGCVNTDMIVVTVNPLPVVTVSTSGLTLTASLTGADYQWMNCADNTDITSATAQTYTATANGSYKVEVTDANGCVATSSCAVVTTVGVEAKSAIDSFSISPNPTKGKVTITAAGNETANVVIFNALGKEVSKVNNIQNGSVIDFSAFNNGVYMVQITTNKGTKVQRVVKN